MKLVNVTQWVRGHEPSNPIRPKASHRVGSQTEGRLQKWGVRSRGKARNQAAPLNPEKCIMVDVRIGPGNRAESQQHAVAGRQQSLSRQGKRGRHHRGLRTGHGFTRVIRELGRASSLLGNRSRNEGDRFAQHLGVGWTMWPVHELNPVTTGKNTNINTSTQGTGRESKADRPGRTKAVVATHSTAGQGRAPAWRRGEPRPKEPTIKAERLREGNAGHDVCAKERQEGL